MSFSWPALLLFVFVTHLPFFAWRYLRTREARYAATTLTFSLLVVTYGLLVFAPEQRFAGVPLYTLVRVAAWVCAAVSVGLLVRHHLAKRRSAVASLRKRAQG